MTIILATLVVIAAVVAYVALRNAQDFSDANEVVPGVDTGAPKEWAGAHSPEARLHRRIRDAMTAVRANAALDEPAMQPVRTSLEEQAVAIDRRLVAVAALPKGHRDAPMAQVAEAVDTIEAAVTSLVLLRGPATADVDQAIADVRMRVELVEAARAELDALSAPTRDLDELRRRLEADEPGRDEGTPGV